MESTGPAPSRRRRHGPRWAHCLVALGAASLGLVTLAAVGGPASATGAGLTSALTATSSKVAVSEKTVAKYGKVLFDQKGFALYYNTANKPPKHWACTGDCLTAWPPLVLPKGQTAAVAGKGVTGLGTVMGPSGRQVTWKGKPLYTFIQDSKGKVTGQGIQGIWFVAQLSAVSKTSTSAASGY